MMLSAICLVHCLVLPFLLALLPLLSISALPEWAHDTEWFHAALLLPVALISGPVLLRASLRSRTVAIISVLAFAALFGALLLPTEFWEEFSTIVGASMLLVAHAINLRRSGTR